MTAPLQLSDLRPEVAAFAILMESKLREKDAHRGCRGWADCRPADLFRWMEVETRELRVEINAAMQHIWRLSERPSDIQGRLSREGPGGRTEVADLDVYTIDRSPAVARLIAREAADVANFAMMIADVSGGLE